jgi:hypothetical protein
MNEQIKSKEPFMKGTQLKQGKGQSIIDMAVVNIVQSQRKYVIFLFTRLDY